MTTVASETKRQNEEEIRRRAATSDLRRARRNGSIMVGFGPDRPPVTLSYRHWDRSYRLVSSDFVLIDVSAQVARRKLASLYVVDFE